jgi:prevent-host-death family protein
MFIGFIFILTIDLFMDYIQSHLKMEDSLKFSSQIKPISYLKAHTAEIVRQLNEHREPLVITQNGEARIVIQEKESYEQTQETVALLKILALGIRQIEEGKVQTATEAIQSLRKRKESH